jgi:hypothetical protein
MSNFPKPGSWKPTGPRTAPSFRRTSSAVPWARSSTACIRLRSGTSSALVSKRRRTGHGGNLHQPSRHVRDLYQRRQERYRWQPRPADPELEAEMLRRLMVRLGVEEARAKTMVAAEQRTGSRQAFARDGRCRCAVARRSLRPCLAACRAGAGSRRFHGRGSRSFAGAVFRALCRSRIDGKKKDESKGFLSKLMFWRAASDKPTQAQYRIHLKAVGEATTVAGL